MTKKQKIEQVAFTLFLKYGFKKVTVDQICKTAHVSRKTYYTYYENKSALVIFVIGRISAETTTKYEAIINGPGTFVEKLEQSLLLKYNFSKTITKEFVADLFDPNSDEVLTYWMRMMQKSMDLVKQFLKHGQQTGEMNPNLKLEYVLWHFQRISDMIKSPELLTMFENVEDMVKQITESLIYGIMPVSSSNDTNQSELNVTI